MATIAINLNSIVRLSDDQFYQLCRDNPDVKFERSPNGEILILSPTDGETGRLNADLVTDLTLWRRQTRSGVVFDSSTCFC